MLNPFADNDAYGTVSLTTAINKLPIVPGMLGTMNLFRRKPVTTSVIGIEEKQGKLGLVPTAARGTMPNVMSGPKRKFRTFAVPFIPLNESVMAEDVQNIREFGDESAQEQVARLVNDKLTDIKQNIDITLEYHRAGALSGKIMEPDGTTVIYDFFDEFDLTETEVEFFGAGTSVKTKSLEALRAIGDALGATPYSKVYALCGDDFFDELIGDSEVSDAFAMAQNAGFFLTQQATIGGATPRGFEYADVTWFNYRSSVGNRKFIAADEARFFPIGAPDLFEEYNAPAPFMETVNTLGKPYYAKQEPMKYDVGTELHGNTSTLYVCTRPQCLVKGTIAA